MGDYNTWRCCCTPCSDGGTCSLPHNHAGEHYSDKEMMLDFKNPARHTLAAKDAEIARLKAEVERLTADVKEIGDLLVAERTSRNSVMQKKVAAHERYQADLARHKRALAAGPADLRWRGPMSGEEAARNVERAQAAAMKEEP